MALLEDLLKSETTRGMAVGMAAAALAPLVLPALAGMARPFARAAIKTGIILYEKTRETAAEVGEVFDDLVAEARAELEQEEAATKSGAAAQASGSTAVDVAEPPPEP